MGYPEGFPGQRFAVVPYHLRDSGTTFRPLGVALAGWFPDADHEHERPNGAAEGIVLVCFRGVGWYRTHGVEHSISAGQAICVPAGQPHAYGAAPGHPWTIGWVHLNGAGVDELRYAADGEPNPIVLTTGNLDKAAELIGEIITYIEREVAPSTLTAASGAASHLLAVLNLGTHSTLEAHDPVQRAISYLTGSLNQSITLRQVAEESGLSTSQLTARFRRETGTSVIEYRTRLRLARACLLLETTRLPIRTIADRLGYDPYYFSRQFGAHYGLSPRAYRQRASTSPG